MLNEHIGIVDTIEVKLIKNETKVRKIIAVGGQPGTGKTTLFRKFMEDKKWIETAPAKLVVASYNTEKDLYILGKYEEGETFAGTDRLGMSVQPNMQEWIASHNCNVLFEGDRLTNSKFYDFLLNLPNTDVKIIILSTADIELKKRYISRGSNQSETFLKGRETKISNILNNFEYRDNIFQFNNQTLEDQKIILNFIDNFLCDKN